MLLHLDVSGSVGHTFQSRAHFHLINSGTCYKLCDRLRLYLPRFQVNARFDGSFPLSSHPFGRNLLDKVESGELKMTKSHFWDFKTSVFIIPKK